MDKILNLTNETELSGFYVFYKGSTLNERVGIRGISHLMEHLMCKGIIQFTDEFDQNGISWNAGTGDDYIVFYFTGLEEKLDLFRDRIVTALSTFKVTEKQFENERKIVIEEYKDAFNDQAEYHMENLDRKLFNIYNPIGELGDLQTLTFKDCKDYFELQYKHPTNIVNVSKSKKYENKLEFSEFNDKLNKEIKYLDNNKFILEKSNDFKDKTSIIYLSDIVNDDYAAVKFICNMIGFGLKSPLYTEIREKRGLVYYVRCGLNKKNDVSGYVSISAMTSNANVDEYVETLDDVLSKPEVFLTVERFNIIKDMFNTKFKMSNINRHVSVDKYFAPDNWNLEYYLDILTLDDLKAVYKKYFTNWYRSIDKKEFN